MAWRPDVEAQDEHELHMARLRAIATADAVEKEALGSKEADRQAADRFRSHGGPRPLVPADRLLLKRLRSETWSRHVGRLG
jgi:hypothetical protein